MGNILGEMGTPRSVAEDAEWDRNRVEEDPVLWELAMTDKAHREELAKSPPYDVLERKVAEACEEQGVPMIPAENIPETIPRETTMNDREKAELVGEIANSETYEGVFALGIAALVEAVEKGFGMIAAQLSALGAQRTADRAVREKEAEAVAAGTYDEFVNGLSDLVAKHGEYAVKRGIKLWLLEQLDDDAYALVETDEQGRYRDVLDGKVIWDPDAEEEEVSDDQ